MACAFPLEIPNPRYKDITYGIKGLNKTMLIPCGWCLNCRVDKRNFLEDCCNFLHGKYGYCAFVTFTYDDNWLINNCNPFKMPITCSSIKRITWIDKRRREMELLRIRKQSMFSLNRDDARLLNYRIRSAVHNLPDCPANNHNYKMLYVGEYGGKFQRPHLHYLFFGIDFTSPLFQKCWKYGLVKSLPIRNGAFRYVIDYLDKQVHGYLAEELYDDCGLVRPFMGKSMDFATDFVLSKLDECIKHNGSYYTSERKLRPLPIYYRNLYKVRVNPFISKLALRDKYFRQYNASFEPLVDRNKFLHFKQDMALIRFRHLREINRQKQIAVDDSLLENSSSLNSFQFGDLVLKALDYTYLNGEWIPF